MRPTSTDPLPTFPNYPPQPRTLRLPKTDGLPPVERAGKAAAEAAQKLRDERAEKKKREDALGPIRRGALWTSRKWYAAAPPRLLFGAAADPRSFDSQVVRPALADADRRVLDHAGDVRPAGPGQRDARERVHQRDGESIYGLLHHRGKRRCPLPAAAHSRLLAIVFWPQAAFSLLFLSTDLSYTQVLVVWTAEGFFGYFNETRKITMQASRT